MASTKLTNIDGNLPRDVLLIALRTNMPQVFRGCLHAVAEPTAHKRMGGVVTAERAAAKPAVPAAATAVGRCDR